MCDISNDDGFRVAAKTIPQKEGQLTIAIVYVSGLALGDIYEGVDDDTQRRERLIDHPCLLESLPLSLRMFRTF